MIALNSLIPCRFKANLHVHEMKCGCETGSNCANPLCWRYNPGGSPLDVPVEVVTLRQQLRRRAVHRVSERRRREKLAVIRFEETAPVKHRRVKQALQRQADDVKQDRAAYLRAYMKEYQRRRRAAKLVKPPA